MKRILPFFCSTLLFLTASLLMLSIRSGIVIVLLFLLRFLAPVVHFGIIGHDMKQNPRRKSVTVAAVISTVLLLSSVVLLNLAAKSVISGFRLLVPYTAGELIWVLLCGAVILGNIAVSHKRLSGILIVIEAVIALAINAVMTFFLSSALSPLAIDAVEVLLIPLSTIILSLISFFIGRAMTPDRIKLKLSAWFFGIMTSVFVSLWLLQKPLTTPVITPVYAVIWLALTFVPFGAALLGRVRFNLKYTPYSGMTTTA